MVPVRTADFHGSIWPSPSPVERLATGSSGIRTSGRAEQISLELLQVHRRRKVVASLRLISLIRLWNLSLKLARLLDVLAVLGSREMNLLTFQLHRSL